MITGIMSNRFLIVGLGNPGREYESTRHNIGFQCVDALARTHNLRYESNKRSKAKIAQGTVAGQTVTLAKPQTYMNLSGSAVQGLAAFYRIPPERIIVVLDDLDIALGTLRIRPKGGTAGHKGLTDIVARLGTQDIPRIRFGIGRPPGRMDPAAFVLRRFSSDEQPVVDEAIARVVGAVETWLTDGIDIAMNRFNGSAEEAAARFEQPDMPTQPPSGRPSAQDT